MYAYMCIYIYIYIYNLYTYIWPYQEHAYYPKDHQQRDHFYRESLHRCLIRAVSWVEIVPCRVCI